MRRLLITLIAGLTLTGCTLDQMETWIAWRTVDPVGAAAYLALPEVQHHLAADWDHDGIIEPDPTLPPAPTVRDDQDSPSPRTVSTGSVWDRLAECESGGDWSYNGSSGYDGGLQFSPSTWRAMNGPTDYAWQATREQQIAVAERLLDVSGWGAWPGCSRKLGLR